MATFRNDSLTPHGAEGHYAIMVTPSRLKAEFFDDFPPPWLPAHLVWRAAAACYALLAVWQLAQGNLLVGALCAAAVVAISPRLRKATLGRLRRLTKSSRS